MTYTDEQRAEHVERAFDLFAEEGLSIREAALQLGVYYRTLHDWMLRPENVEQYTRARLIRADEAVAENRRLKKRMLDGGLPADVARVAIGSNQWEAGKMNKGLYGEKQTTEIVGKDGGAIKIDSTMTASDATAAYLAGLK